MTTAIISHVPPDATDSVADLLRRISDRDPAAWDDILRRHGTLVSATVRSFRLQEADAFDAVQMTWLRLAENAHRVRFPERLGGWLATTARRECLHILRQAKLGHNRADGAPDDVADPCAGPEQRTIDTLTTRTLRTLIDELPPRRATLIRLLFTDNPRSYAEIARIAAIPPGGIGPTRARALRELRDKLDDHELRPGA
ncbi:MAG: sigma-70 family RNA polymerase sigma factor [Pseudonocardiales bacterium]|nr:sigma-70 family RNA polymerase sigma factor [Pseudonocardiales bacterium]MBV9031539.1 sigma-70 family RNA polymerase sigma factor [Pseudonocardiales bacterium]MBW0010859.1 sigma-70 family RNA polymerase sigma factor [Pseudonocardiales bacterium]